MLECFVISLFCFLCLPLFIFCLIIWLQLDNQRFLILLIIPILKFLGEFFLLDYLPFSFIVALIKLPFVGHIFKNWTAFCSKTCKIFVSNCAAFFTHENLLLYPDLKIEKVINVGVSCYGICYAICTLRMSSMKYKLPIFLILLSEPDPVWNRLLGVHSGEQDISRSLFHEV